MIRIVQVRFIEIQEYNAYNNEDNLSSYEIITKYLPVLDFKNL